MPVKEHRGRDWISKDINLRVRHCPGEPASYLPLAEDREGGWAIMGVRAEQLIHILHFYTGHFTVYIYSNTDAALTQGLVLLQTGGIWKSQDVVSSDPDAKPAI